VRARQAGFTLIELLVVVAIVAIASAVVTLAVRDPDASRLDREAARLSALLEGARADARAAGLAVAWAPAAEAEQGFRFVGLPATSEMPTQWLGPGVSAQVIGARAVQLGPEPVIGAQRILLRLGDQRLELATDGLGAFEPSGSEAVGP